LSVNNAPRLAAPIGRVCHFTAALALVVGVHAVTILRTSDPAVLGCVGG
jgi:hypothetical protein